jgi:hypothetical protein
MVSGRPVEVVSHAKLLGLTISDSLQWNKHIEETIKKANKRLYCPVQLRRARVSVKEIVQFYCTCISPVLEYAAPVFHHALPKYLEEDLERVRKRSLSIIYNGAPHKENLLDAGIDSLYDRRQTCNELFQSIKSDSTNKLYQLLPPMPLRIMYIT